MLVVNAKKSLSSYQLARDLEMNQKSAWFMQQRIRAAMASDQSPMLTGVVEADETYVGEKPRKSKKRKDNDKPNSVDAARTRPRSSARSSGTET